MSERYSRLFSLPGNLYTDGSPVLVVAGALLHDRLSGNVLAQLKLRNISSKPIKSVKVRIIAYDTANGQLRGVEEFSYLDLSAASNEEFGPNIPIILPDAATRSFCVEILSAVYADNEVFYPRAEAQTEVAPSEILEDVKRIETEKWLAREAAKAELAKKKADRNKQSMVIMVCAIVSFVFVIISLIGIMGNGTPFRFFWHRYYLSIIFAFITPCICLVAAFAAKKTPTILKPAAIICTVMLGLQVVLLLIYGFTALGVPNSMGSFIARTVNGTYYAPRFCQLLRATFRGIPVRVLMREIQNILPGIFAIAPNILTSAVLMVYSKKYK